MTPQTAQNAHSSALAAKHAALETQIEEELTQLHPDHIKLQSLKKQKLAVKDALA